MDLVKSIRYPEEVYALLKYKFGGCQAVISKNDLKNESPQLRKCYEYLNKTSRSFAAVIQALDRELRHAVCIFYLVLRALDTVEDDMTIPLEVKVPLLRSFYTKLQEPDWCFMDSKEKDKIVLEDFSTISHEFRKLAPLYQEVISDICCKMGDGMTVFLEGHVDSKKQWDEYCHYVAGLVGIGLSRLFSASGLEDSIVGQDTRLANSMGLFLQKTNIIRDYLEDIEQGREFWPKEVWSKYANKLSDFADPANRRAALSCLNDLVTNALHHVPDVLLYMSRIKNQSVFNFCAIPQVMAIGTLERCYNNPGVFTGVVKIRKGEAVRMMMYATSLEGVKAIMYHFTAQILHSIPSTDPSQNITRRCCHQVLERSCTDKDYTSSGQFFPLYVSCSMMLAAIMWQYWTSVENIYHGYFGMES
ncbi:squalene synthase-like [Lingula anatina]|uniref:Squalene synthase n=1 Tax=Lingula anatina TaxID=7574 RepID=A0A1S3H1Z3_LINAN|nr:squalene synthase-like [Lingula anatina]|eukprot:XP_013379159.1 squalene synthase-like [Lingula anatina]